MKHIAFVVADAMTAEAFLREIFKELGGDHRITLIAGTEPKSKLEGVSKFEKVDICRSPQPRKDLGAIWALVKLFRRERFDSVHSITPKAGLLAMSAARLARVPTRIHTFTGQVWASLPNGAKRTGLRLLDRITAMNATLVLADSPSQLAFLKAEHVVPERKGTVLGKGSVSGVDLKRFRPDPMTRDNLRRDLGIAQEAVVFLFLGRVTEDKGIVELLSAFDRCRTAVPTAHLLVVGHDEMKSITKPRSVDTQLRFLGPTDQPEKYLQMADLLLLPSYREGFGNVVVEAAACGIPTIASAIYGLTDAVEAGVTGELVEVKNVSALSESMSRLALDSEARDALAAAALQRARREFDSDLYRALWRQLYR
jgi:glycosyltransferase involved in cell wall biosynthesis